MNIKEIAERLKTDREFAEKYSRLTDADEIIAQAKEDGCDATKEDADAILRELSEKELAFVAGGSGYVDPAKIKDSKKKKDKDPMLI